MSGKKKEELEPQYPCKEYFQAHLDACNKLKEDIKTAVGVIMLPLKVAGLVFACAAAV